MYNKALLNSQHIIDYFLNIHILILSLIQHISKRYKYHTKDSYLFHGVWVTIQILLTMCESQDEKGVETDSLCSQTTFYCNVLERDCVRVRWSEKK